MLRIVLTLGVVIGACACGQSPGPPALELGDVAATPGFTMADDLIATIARSSDQSEVGKNVTFVGLRSSNPRVVFEDTGGTSPVRKVYEDDKSLTLLLVASGTGGVDAFVIDKKTGLFARAAASSTAGVHALAAVGSCK